MSIRSSLANYVPSGVNDEDRHKASQCLWWDYRSGVINVNDSDLDWEHRQWFINLMNERYGKGRG